MGKEELGQEYLPKVETTGWGYRGSGIVSSITQTGVHASREKIKGKKNAPEGAFKY